MVEDRRNWMAKDLAELAGLDPSRIRQLLLAGKIHGEKVGQVWVVSNQEAKRWLRSRGVEVESDDA